jgi:hypothetical protein
MLLERRHHLFADLLLQRESSREGVDYPRNRPDADEVLLRREGDHRRSGRLNEVVGTRGHDRDIAYDDKFGSAPEDVAREERIDIDAVALEQLVDILLRHAGTGTQQLRLALRVAAESAQEILNRLRCGISVHGTSLS